MSQYNDVMLIEGATDEPYDENDYYAAIQRQINAGCWSLQGSHGRTMMDAIKAGRCMLGTTRAKDYWGNVIPARTDVEAGTKGSREFVVAAMGEDWAVEMENAS
jgi:hypothetical protein